ncbi:hypothetical protein HPP92_006143 [Vanilla planifolia]|uniref:Heparan-alpha-glucosaminide N-acetyltransferase catalytic domain-containing protein n=1 Tax=Vanilla planifolia TaxID=51239 RepID=A0A835RTD7_VANPL|nr:hypothetical protein HPP92_006143 [Vanilla planifolia]
MTMVGYELVRSDDGLAMSTDPIGKRLNEIEEGGSGKFSQWKDDRRSDQPASGRGSRLVSLDVFRGITVALMIMVDDAGSFSPAINHSPWNGVTIADFVMPFFLFIVGVSLGLAYKNVTDRIAATRKAVLRALKLFIMGLILQGGFFHGVRNLTFGVDLLNIRLMGVLQRIAVAYLFVAMCEVWLRSNVLVNSGYSMLKRYRLQLFVGGLLTALYMVLLYGLLVPDWQYEIPDKDSIPKLYFVNCGVRGDTSPACNVVGMLDRKILGINHLYRHPVYGRTKQCSINSPYNGPLPPDAPPWCEAPFDPEGLLSTVMAVVTCLIGLHFGHVILHFKDHKDRIFQWIVPSFCLLALTFFLDFCGMVMNKSLYTLSYTFYTAGAAGLLFAVLYLLVDVYNYRRLTYVMEWMGKHALMIYVLIACNILPIFIHGFYWKEPKNNLLRLVGIGA